TAIPLQTKNLAEAANGMLEVLVKELDNVDGCSILLLESAEQRLELVAAGGQADFRGESQKVYKQELAFRLGEDLAGQVFEQNAPIFWNADSPDRDLINENQHLTTPKSLACLPLKFADRPIGVLNVSFGEAKSFDQPRKRNLILLSEVVANIIQDFLLKGEVDDKAVALEHKVGEWEREMAFRKQAEKEIEILAKFPDENPHPILRVSLDRTILYANPASASLLERWRTAVGKSLPPLWEEPLAEAAASGFLAGFEVEVEDSVFTFMTVPVSDTETLYLFGQDVTENKDYEQQLLLMASVFENTIEGIIVTSADGTIEKVNRAFTQITGYTQEEAVGQNPRLLKSGRHGPEFYASMWDELLRTGHWTSQVWNRRKNGEAYPQWLSLSAIKDSRGQTLHYVAVFHDITDIKFKEEKIKYQAEHDPLTGLPNRALFYDRLTMTLARAHRNKEMAALLFLDLDNFKNINDSLGHALGDLLLRQVAERLKFCVREEDTVARLGGDEFTIILPEIHSRREVGQAARRIIEAMAAPVEISGQELHIGISIGVTTYPLDGDDSETLVKNADMAMYKAKAQGKNNYQHFTPSLNVTVQKRLEMDRSLRRALEAEEFVLHYQPKVELAGGRVVGVEALVRWNRPGVGLWTPDKFISWTEESGLIAPLGEWVLRSAGRQVKKWQEAGFENLRVAVNLSPRHFSYEGLISMVEKVLAETGLAPQLLELELTETAVARNVETAILTMRRLNDLGVKISLDDFGTGYSSLTHLKSFPIYALKIDQSFIHDIPFHADDMAIATAIVYMARSLNLRVVAEGVETQAQLEFLRELECDEIQGFLFSPALPADEF
ncbi:MAG: EAL domain-containing protein, partial [Pseudomonadota bacterium]